MKSSEARRLGTSPRSAFCWLTDLERFTHLSVCLLSAQYLEGGEWVPHRLLLRSEKHHPGKGPHSQEAGRTLALYGSNPNL